jgi:glycosyltransferase involved in cell wall biosynthesis
MKFSIITVCKNSEKTIESTILSVLNQNYKDFEYIIIDGVSTDSTLDIIEKYRNKISKVICEPDNGLYDAMNKGIKFSKGEYLFFLNSDDTFLHDNILQLISNYTENQPDLIYGDLTVLDKKTGKFSIQKHNKFNKIYLIKNTPCQPATFYNRQAFEKYGDFDSNYKIVADHEWFLRIFRHHSGKITAKYTGFPISIFNLGGISTSKEREAKITLERNDMLNKYFSASERKICELFSKYLRSLTTLPLIKRFFSI